jgi:trichodiene synthase
MSNCMDMAVDSGIDLPLDHYVDSVVNFLDAVQYKEEDHGNRDELLRNFRHVYVETVKYFSEPSIKSALSLDDQTITLQSRNISRLTVYCWPKVPLRVMVPISIHFMFTIFLDDILEDHYDHMESFSEDLFRGRDQKNPVWRVLLHHFPNLLQHYGGFCQLTILRSTLDFYQCCWMEAHSFHGYRGSDCYPLFQRRLGVLGGMCGACLFPTSSLDENEVFDELATVLAQMDPVTMFVNDLFSFYKELLSPRARNPRDQNNLVMNTCQVEGISPLQALNRLTGNTINGVRRMQELFNNDKRTPAVAEAVHEFVRGYVRWHLCDDKRYRLREVYDACSQMQNGPRLRRYLDMAWYAGGVDVEDQLLGQQHYRPTFAPATAGKLSRNQKMTTKDYSNWVSLQFVLLVVLSILMLNLLQAMFIFRLTWGSALV